MFICYLFNIEYLIMLNRRSLFVVTGYTGDVFNCRFLPRSSSLRTTIDWDPWDHPTYKSNKSSISLNMPKGYRGDRILRLKVTIDHS